MQFRFSEAGKEKSLVRGEEKRWYVSSIVRNFRRLNKTGFWGPRRKLQTITNKSPLGKRMTTAEEIANMVAFLLSERSSNTTGQIIHADGGYVHLDRAISWFINHPVF